MKHPSLGGEYFSPSLISNLPQPPQLLGECAPGPLWWVPGPLHELVGARTFSLRWMLYSCAVPVRLSVVSPWSFLSLQLVNNPLASQAAAAAAAAAMGSIASSQAFGNALSSLQGVTGQLVTNAQGQVSGRWEQEWIFMADWTRKGNEFLLHDSDM